MSWSPVKVAIVNGGSDGRAAVERLVSAAGIELGTWNEFLWALRAENQRTLFDYETRCEVSVVDVGAYKYARHPSNEVLCVGWRTRPQEGRSFVAHNIAFEEAESQRHVPYWENHDFRWSCTASRARRLGIPGALEGACNVMRTANRKSADGHRVMLQVSQPRPQWVHQRKGAKYFEDAERLAATAIYCARDILAETDLDDVLPELPPNEYAIWDQIERANRRGLRLDLDLIAAMERIVGDNTREVLEEVRRLTGDDNFSLTAPQAVRDFCAARGVYMEDLRAGTVEAVLNGHRSGARLVDSLVVKVLEGRQSVGKSSNAKLPAMRDRLEEDGYARDYAIYHGAHTGRQTGSKVNPLNMPRPYRGYDPEKVIPAIREHDLATLEALRVTPSLAVSASLRGCIVAPEGRQFAIGDYSSVEPCVTFTLAGQWDAVEVLRRRESVYLLLGPAVWGREISKKEVVEYTLCKALTLACGYGQGADGFINKLRSDGVEMPEDDARRGHAAYRTRYPMIPACWKGLEEAFKAAIRNPHTTYYYGVVGFIFDGYWTSMILPSGRSIMYPNTRLLPGKYNDEVVYEGRTRTGSWGDVRTWGGSILENAAQSISRDITVEDKIDVERLLGWHVPLDVYDEIVAECDESEHEPHEKLLAIMRRQRAWLPQMPVWAEGFSAKRYRKD